MSELKPCPFCGGKPTVYADGRNGATYFDCDECNIRLIEADWMFRPTEDRLQAEVDRLNGLLVEAEKWLWKFQKSNPDVEDLVALLDILSKREAPK